ncbi:MAG: hypothetical protein ABW201_07585 [Candidatus Thiodiazotropha sp.]
MTLIQYALLGLFSCPARQNERGVVILHERMITPLGAKKPRPFGVRPEGSALGVRPEGSALGVRLKKHHSALLV